MEVRSLSTSEVILPWVGRHYSVFAPSAGFQLVAALAIQPNYFLNLLSKCAELPKAHGVDSGPTFSERKHYFSMKE